MNGNLPGLKVEDVDAALNAGRLFVQTNRGWYKARRNGQTKRGKLPGEFKIPCKVGFNSYLIVDELMFANGRAEMRDG